MVKAEGCELAMSVTEDALLSGRVRFRQSATGYRAGMDAALLAAACDAKAGDRVLDVGCGAGGVMLAAAARTASATFVGLERDPAALARATENIALNGWEDRMTAVAGDVAEPWSGPALPTFDAVLCNPPYFDDASALRGPSPTKEGAWIAEAGLAVWIGFLIKAVREGGTITLIHRADRLADILSRLAPKAGSFQIRPVQAFADTAAKRVIVRAVKTGRAPLRLLPALVVRAESPDGHSAAAAQIYAGGPLPWSS